ncbi:MAG: hypothetical protein ACR2K1_04000, partial [Saprospiraceae bacterium]
MPKNVAFTIHTARTIMFAELVRVMDHGAQYNRYVESLKENITGKNTKSNQEKTLRFLTQLYAFNMQEPTFACFEYCWSQATQDEKAMLAFLFALGRDYLLRESLPVVLATPVGEKVQIEKLENNIETLHPGRFSPKTRRSIAQNIASSWKQGGYIAGKVKNIRIQTQPGYFATTLALLLSYLHGDRGEFIFKSTWVKALGIGEAQV